MLRAILASALLLTATVAAEPSDDAKALQGTWLLEAAKLQGRDHTEDFAGMKLIIKDNHYTVDFGKNTDKGTFTLDPKATPKRIDIKSAEGPFKGKTLPGIYELNGDVLVLCLDADGKAELRPKAFDAPEMSRNMLLRYKRAK